MTPRLRQHATIGTGGIIAASGRPWTVGEAMSPLADVNFAMHPAPDDSHYESWKPTRDERLKKVHS